MLEIYNKLNNNTLKKNIDILLDACEQGDLNLIKYLENSPDIKNKPFLIKFNKKINATEINLGAVLRASQHENIDVLDYFLNQPMYQEYVIKDLNGKTHLHEIYDAVTAINKIKTVKYLLDYYPIDLSKNHWLFWAIEDNNLLLTKTIIDHPSQNIDLTYDDYKDFKHACQLDNKNFLHYFIIEKNILLNKEIKKFINGDNPTEHVYQNVLDILKLKKINNTLNKKLPVNSSISKKIKNICVLSKNT